MKEQEEVVRHLPLPRRLTPPWQLPIRPLAGLPLQETGQGHFPFSRPDKNLSV